MFTFASDFFCRPWIFFSSFSTSFRFSWTEEEEIWKKAFTTQTTNPQLLHVPGVACQIDCFACFTTYFSSFSKANAFQRLEKTYEL